MKIVRFQEGKDRIEKDGSGSINPLTMTRWSP